MPARARTDYNVPAPFGKYARPSARLQPVTHPINRPPGAEAESHCYATFCRDQCKLDDNGNVIGKRTAAAKLVGSSRYGRAAQQPGAFG